MNISDMHETQYHVQNTDVQSQFSIPMKADFEEIDWPSISDLHRPFTSVDLSTGRHNYGDAQLSTDGEADSFDEGTITLHNLPSLRTQVSAADEYLISNMEHNRPDPASQGASTWSDGDARWERRTSPRARSPPLRARTRPRNLRFQTDDRNSSPIRSHSRDRDFFPEHNRSEHPPDFDRTVGQEISNPRLMPFDPRYSLRPPEPQALRRSPSTKQEESLDASFTHPYAYPDFLFKVPAIASNESNGDWTKTSKLAEGRRIQNRIAQHNYRRYLDVFL